MKIIKFSEYLKYCLISLCLLFLFHFETQNIGPLKVSHLWKGCVLLFLVFVLTHRGIIRPFIYMPLLLIALMQLINVELIVNPLNAILMFGVALILPLAGMYVCRFTPKQLEKGLIFFASFFILCFIPYKLGLLTSLGDGYDLDTFGGKGEVEGLIGPFQGVHSASTALAGALLVVIYFLFANTFNRGFLLLLFILGLYFLFNTYARTGMVMLALGLIPIVFHFGKKNIINFFHLAVMGVITAILVSTWVLSNETMMNRITGERLHSTESSSFEQMGSGRGLIYLSSLKIFAEANIVEKIIGIGQSETLHRMEDKIGQRLLPHNGFLLLLLNNGILALLLFLSFMRNIYKLQKDMHQLDSRVLIQALFSAYLTMTFFQNYDLFYTVLLLMLSIASTYKTQLIRNRMQI